MKDHQKWQKFEQKKKNLRSTYFSYCNLQNSKPGTLKTQSVTKIHLNPHAFSQLEVNGYIGRDQILMVLWSIIEKNSRIQTDKKSTTYTGDYTWCVVFHFSKWVIYTKLNFSSLMFSSIDCNIFLRNVRENKIIS